MCGIAGFCARSDTNDLHASLEKMMAEIHHRGPDASGCCVYDSPTNGKIGFGHKRLSIIDLTPNGRQPMDSVNKNSTIIFNGEIYNYKDLRYELEREGYRFKTNTDTEVVLNMYEKYGEACLQHFNGMFAFAIYDRRKDQIFIARDRLGIRPLYYYTDKETIAFASEIKALLRFPAVPKQVNYPALYQYVQFRYVKNPVTIFRGINKLEPGHFMMIKNKQITICQYWDVDNFDKLTGSKEECIHILQQNLENSVKIRMISDVPIGAFLSGGLDSSLVVALMSRFSSQPVNTFSVGLDDPRHSELPYAKVIADYFRTNHHELVITPREITNSLYEAVWYRDAPVSETSDIPIMLLAREAKKYVSVILTGEGSDEVFAGYPKYAYDYLSHTWIFRYLFRQGLCRRVVNHLPYKSRKIKLAFNTLSEDDDVVRYDNWFASYRSDMVGGLFNEDFKRQYSAIATNNTIVSQRRLSNLDRMLYNDVKYWLSDNLLERGDKMLMSAAIEGRVPFLDYNVVELGFRLPDSFKINYLKRKIIVKNLAERYIPKEIINRKKVGFYIPVGDWFRNDLKDYVKDHLLSDRLKERGIFNTGEIARITDAHFKGIGNYEKEIWMLLNLEIWFRVFTEEN